MSEEQKTGSSYMQELDQWIDVHVILPLGEAAQKDEQAWEETMPAVKQAIKGKVFESYKNGRMTRMGGSAPDNLPTPRRYPVPMRRR